LRIEKGSRVFIALVPAKPEALPKPEVEALGKTLPEVSVSKVQA